MYYDKVISEVKKDVKGEVVTFNLGLVLRLDLMRPDLVLTYAVEMAKKPIQVKPLVGLSQKWTFCVCTCVHCACACVQWQRRCVCKHKRNLRGC